MAIKLVANYSKKLGLPGYSSHQFEISVEVEINQMSDVEQQSAQLYHLLQQSVDQQIQQIGFVPDEGYGKVRPLEPRDERRSTQGRSTYVKEPTSSPTHINGAFSNNSTCQWQCSDKQQSLLLDLSHQCGLDIKQLTLLTQERFGKTAQDINKLEASGLISELMQRTGKNTTPSTKGNGNYSRRPNKVNYATTR